MFNIKKAPGEQYCRFLPNHPDAIVILDLISRAC